eukprot:TRINITY_DN1811_c0_g1_i1.p1 TRINITY_DN1811_c0_g1~~TRINITY_DN1811_c0_g1_i1.p1  ORF type:complete len:102 (+),score=19.94 TRINITY_DN1811_c0_g1_i1:118-423(+)
MAAQCCHGSVGAYRISHTKREWYRNVKVWERVGAKKIVLSVPDEDAFDELIAKLSESNLAFRVITDAGHTQLPPNTRTVIGIGPADKSELFPFTGKLKLVN